MSRVDHARTRARTEEGSTLVLLHPGDVTDAELAGHLVALLFAAAGPLTPDDAARLLEITPQRLEQICELLDHEPPPGLALQRGPERLQLTTAPGSTPVVERYLGAPPPVRLSRAALEALAVIAYRGPATRGEIDSIRGVNSDSAVATLLGRNLVSEVGRRDSAGRPALLGVTPECLQYLGLRSLEELPPLPEAELNLPQASEAPPALVDPQVPFTDSEDIPPEEQLVDVPCEDEGPEGFDVLELTEFEDSETS